MKRRKEVFSTKPAVSGPRNISPDRPTLRTVPVVRCRDINIYYEVLGSGDPLVFIAGLGSSSTLWQPFQVPFFSRKFQVVVFDNRGVGRTDAPDSEYSIDMKADDTAALLDALRVESAHVRGESMGGVLPSLSL